MTSYSAMGICSNPEEQKKKFLPTVHHTVTITTEVMDTWGSVSQLTEGKPMAVIMLLIRPNPGVNSQFQISTTTVTGRTKGAKKARRNSHLAGMVRLISNASARASTTRTGVLSTVKRMVCQSELQKLGSPKSSW